MFGDICLFSFTLVNTGALIFILVFFIITLSDLECDYLNAQECCGRLNFWNIPKLWLQLLIPMILALTGHWVLVLLSIPICIWLIRKFHFISKGNIGGLSLIGVILYFYRNLNCNQKVKSHL